MPFTPEETEAVARWRSRAGETLREAMARRSEEERLDHERHVMAMQAAAREALRERPPQTEEPIYEYVAPPGCALLRCGDEYIALSSGQRYVGQIRDDWMVDEIRNAVDGSRRVRTIRLREVARPVGHAVRREYEWRELSVPVRVENEQPEPDDTMRQQFEYSATVHITLDMLADHGNGVIREQVVEMERDFNLWLAGRVVDHWFIEPCYVTNRDFWQDVFSVKFMAVGWFSDRVKKGTPTIEVTR